jgi:hypothetical protein
VRRHCRDRAYSASECRALGRENLVDGGHRRSPIDGNYGECAAGSLGTRPAIPKVCSSR